MYVSLMTLLLEKMEDVCLACVDQAPHCFSVLVRAQSQGKRSVCVCVYLYLYAIIGIAKGNFVLHTLDFRSPGQSLSGIGKLIFNRLIRCDYEVRSQSEYLG